MDEFEEKLHRTWIQLLIDDNHTELAAMLIDGSLEVTKTPELYLEHGEDASRGLEVEIPHEYYDMIITNALYPDVIESSLKKLFRQHVRLWGNIKIRISLRIKLIDVEQGWKEKVRAIILNAQAPNQGALTEKVFASKGQQPILYQEMKFGSISEVRIAQALASRGVLFFPLPLAVRSETGASYMDRREPDFLVCHEGVWGILEVAFHPDRYEKESEKDVWFKQSGIVCIQNYTAERCFNHPSEVVDEFLHILATHKR
jgi:hypothetical protein